MQGHHKYVTQSCKKLENNQEWLPPLCMKKIDSLHDVIFISSSIKTLVVSQSSLVLKKLKTSLLKKNRIVGQHDINPLIKCD